MKKDLITTADIVNAILVTVIVIFVAALIYYGFFSFLGLPGIKKQEDTSNRIKTEQKVQKNDEAYRKLIESSRSEYKSFMDQQKIK